MIIETCPQCGADLEDLALTINPPIHIKRCPKCGWKYEEREQIIRIPFDNTKNYGQSYNY